MLGAEGHTTRQLAQAIRKQESALRPLREESERLRDELDGMVRSESADLERALTIALINESFLKIPGIGTKLKDRIMQACFDGSLGSLLRAQQVNGVGQEKSFAIRTWVSQIQRSFPKRLNGDFAGKGAILEKYAPRQRELDAQMESLDSEIKAREQVVSEARARQERLTSVSPRDFRRALRGNRKAAEKVARHALGSFAERMRGRVFILSVFACCTCVFG
jgi:hypothetical protein